MIQRALVCLVLFVFSASLGAAQEHFPWFTPDFPPEEFAARRAKVFDDIGDEAIALLQGAPSPAGHVRFTQTKDFYYLSGVEVPHAYLLLDGRRQTTHLYLPRRDDRRESSEGTLLNADDAERVKELTGVDEVFAVDELPGHLARGLRSSTPPTLYTRWSPEVRVSGSRDMALRALGDAASDPFDGGISRETRFRSRLTELFPQLEQRDLTPILDQIRLIKSPLEIEWIKKATRLSGLTLMEGMRSTEPGIYEYELDGMAKYIHYRNGAQGDAYYSLIASASNAWYPHYNAGKRKMQEGDFLLFDFAPDIGYYVSDVTRMWPVDGTFSDWQAELYDFYLATYRAILDRIRPGVTPGQIIEEAGAEMEKILAATTFSKEIYQKAAEKFVENYPKRASYPGAMLGHWVGLEAHDVGHLEGNLEPGMVFTIEPQLRVPEEQIYIRLEDLIVITEDGADIVSDWVPLDRDEIEAVMREEGMLQRYPMDR